MMESGSQLCSGWPWILPVSQQAWRDRARCGATKKNEAIQHETRWDGKTNNIIYSTREGQSTCCEWKPAATKQGVPFSFQNLYWRLKFWLKSGFDSLPNVHACVHVARLWGLLGIHEAKYSHEMARALAQKWVWFSILDGIAVEIWANTTNSVWSSKASPVSCIVGLKNGAKWKVT